MQAINSEYDTILQKVRRWPPKQRVALVQDVLETLTTAMETPAPRPKNTLSLALGFLVTERATPNDEEVDRWLAEHRLTKYG